MTPWIENFSRDYWMVCDAEVNKHEGDLALMDEDLYDDLVEAIGEPIIGFVGGLHYEFIPSRQVLADRCAVPRRNHKASHNSMTLLLSK